MNSKICVNANRVPKSGTSVSRCMVLVHLFTVTVLLSLSIDGLAQENSDGIAESGLYAGGNSGQQPGPFTGTLNINDFFGAERFYDEGLTGTNAVIATIEAGHPWTGHETLTHAQQINNPYINDQVDRHSTWVSMVLGGRTTPSNPGEHQRGLAPDAELHTGAISPGWSTSSSRYSTAFTLNFYAMSTYSPYRAAFLDGITGPDNTRTADVVNSSYNANISGAQSGTDRISGTLDALANSNPRTLFTTSVGNTLPSGSGPNKVNSPAAGYNNIAVGSLGIATNGFVNPSTFSNGGPNDYKDPVTGTVSQARQVVDIGAPGQHLSAAYYGGETGGNAPTLVGPANGPAGGADYYTRSLSGTSFAAPSVAGSAALIYDAAYSLLSDNDDARDARVVKAVLMNSADKTRNWDNGQIAHPNNHGGVLTNQGLDNRVGTGRLNLDKAFEQFLFGTTDVPDQNQGNLGMVEESGWDFGTVNEGITNDYFISQPLETGSTFNATLTWYRDRAQLGNTSFTEQSYDNLDLELWTASGSSPIDLISVSSSPYNNSEHFSFEIPKTDHYVLRVRWTDEVFDQVSSANVETYGLAWSGTALPEPNSILLALVTATGLFVNTRWRKQRSGKPGALENA